MTDIEQVTDDLIDTLADQASKAKKLVVNGDSKEAHDIAGLAEAAKTLRAIAQARASDDASGLAGFGLHIQKAKFGGGGD